MNRLFLAVLISLLFNSAQNMSCGENSHTGLIDALMLKCKISQEGLDTVTSQIYNHSFTESIFHDPAARQCVNNAACGTEYSPFIIECPELQRDNSELSRAIYARIDEGIFYSRNKLNRYMASYVRGNMVDHCTYYVQGNNLNLSIYTYFFDKVALIKLLECLRNNNSMEQ